jgi:hypothetical protein
MADINHDELVNSEENEAAEWSAPCLTDFDHFYSGRLSTALNKKLGIFVRPARGAALSALAADLPAPVLGDLLGLSISTAT